ncbi:hypothetical protein ACG873_23855 [Mesorhizobium sp. AaZ16]|uniref:hypothetical protein n=1 Tax=Mesorhizobium sp. AaZ16 TaxID=3402289 RepID=UPI00374ED1FB
MAFTASGPMAVLDAVAPDELAKKLGITPEIATVGKFLGEKVVLETKEEDLGMVFETRITLNVSTVDTPSGQDACGMFLQDRSAISRTPGPTRRRGI